MEHGYLLATYKNGRIFRCRVNREAVRLPWDEGVSAVACDRGVILNGKTGRILEPGFAEEIGGNLISCLTVFRDKAGSEAFCLGTDLIASSEQMLKVFHTAICIAPLPDPVTLLGESGCGKELLARAIHVLGRPSKPLVALNLAAIPYDLIEAELFGWVRGAFTGATESRQGAFESAASGTLFLDEITEAPLAVQVKLLRAVETGMVHRIGSCRPVEPNFRVLAASNRDLAYAVSTGQFRLDLAERLACIVIKVPPLRSRPEDLPVLARFLCSRMPDTPVLHRDAIDVLMTHDWRGNVRELKNVLRRASVMSRSGMVGAEAIREAIAAGDFIRGASGCAEAISWGRRTRAEEIAASGIPRSTYYYRLKRGRISAVDAQ